MNKICKVCKQHIWIKDKNDKIIFCGSSFHITQSELSKEYKRKLLQREKDNSCKNSVELTRKICLEHLGLL